MPQDATATTPRRWDTALRILVWGGSATLLALPAVAMRFTSEVLWDVPDFAVFGAMLLVACTIFEITLRASASWAYRVAAALAVGTAFLLILVNLAVGFIGEEGDPANLLFLAVIAIALGGAVFSRGRPRPLSGAMTATAGAQALVAPVALAAGWGRYSAAWPWDIIGGTLLFTAFWLLSAALFRAAPGD